MTRLSILAAAAVVCAACTDTGSTSIGWTVTDVESPAGGGSGEPFLSAASTGVTLSWLEAVEEGHELRVAQWRDEAWSPVRTVAKGDDFFVNWADFPSVRAAPNGTLWAHWLQRGGQGTYDYDVRISYSADAGESWSGAWTPHETETPTEHGFVSMVVSNDSVDFLWLDGRLTGGGHGDSEAVPGPMTLRTRTLFPTGPGPDVLVDDRVCDCCQTAMARTDDGLVAVYRNRTEGEIRDIYVTRRIGGEWTEGRPVYNDGWEIAGCPVNGPMVRANGNDVAVAWFAAPGDAPRVQVAFSIDGGATFGAPARIDEGNPGGRVDILPLESGAVFVTWMERVGDGAEIRIRKVEQDGSFSESEALVESSAARSAGFPRIAREGANSALITWTDATVDPARVRVKRLEWEEG